MSSVLAKKEHPDNPIELGNENPIAVMLRSMIEHGVTADNVSAMEKMTDLYLRVEAENAKRAFAKAKCELQSELPKIVATRIIPNNDGTIRSVYAKSEDIVPIVEPYLTKHGFSASYTTRIDESGGKERICAILKLSHIGGHSETNEFAVRVTKPPGANDAQGDTATLSYAQRGVFCLAFNIIINTDMDARMEGDYIKPEQAEAFKARVIATKSDEVKFLKLAGAESYDKIRSGKMSMLDFLLSRKEAEDKKGKR